MNNDKNEKKILDTIREVNKKEKQEQLRRQSEYQEQIRLKAQKRRQEYEKKLDQERLELLKLRQGVSCEIPPEDEQKDDNETKKRTLGQKISSFFYLNKLMIIAVSVFVFIAAFLAYDLIRKDRPDLTVMVLVNDPYFEASMHNMEDKFAEYIDDVNGNGEIHATFYYMPVSSDTDSYSYGANTTKLYALMQTPDTIMVIADKSVYDQIMPDTTLYNLENDFKDNKYVDGYGFYFGATDFMKDVGYSSDTDTEGYYIGLRKVSESVSGKNKMTENFNTAYDALTKFIDEYSK